MAQQESVSLWIQQLKQGNSLAAQNLWNRYYHRLVGLARKKLGDSPRRVTDEEDVVQSAFNSFCQRAKAGQFPDLRDRENLWPLLVLITVRKALNQRVRERRAKRGGGRANVTLTPDATDSTCSHFVQAISGEPSPDDAAVFLSEFSRFMESLDDPSHRLILLWKLEERSNPEMAKLLDCSLSAIERKLRLIRNRLNDDVES